MDESSKTYRLSKLASEFNVAIGTIQDFLKKKGHNIDVNPNSKVDQGLYELLEKEYQPEKQVKEVSKKIDIGLGKHETITVEKAKEREKQHDYEEEPELLIKGVQSLDHYKDKEKEPKTTDKTPVKAEEVVAEIKDSKRKAAEEETKEETTKKKKTAAQSKAKEKEALEEVKPVEEEIKSEEEKSEKGLKVIRTIDLETLEKSKKGRKGTKSKKETDAEIEEEKKSTKKKVKKDEPLAEEIVEKAKEVEKIKKSAKSKDVDIVLEEVTSDEITVEVDLEDISTEDPDQNFIPTEYVKINGPKILGKIELKKEQEPKPKLVASSAEDKGLAKKKKRKRIKKSVTTEEGAPKEIKTDTKNTFKKQTKKEPRHSEVSDEEIEKQIKETLARLSAPTKSKASKYRRQKRDQVQLAQEEEQSKIAEDKKTLKVTEFVTAKELASMMDVQVNEVISTCMSLGLFVSINQRLDAETLSIVADEFGYKTEFVSADVQEAIDEIEEIDNPTDLIERHPIVTVMGHVDHGKTSLLDYIRRSNVIAGEAGGITQHIGSYEVQLDSGKKITFLDTPGHEAFTAMRARGAKITDIAIIVIAADDNVMPQTVEAINHAQAARVPIIFAINKIDKAGATPDKIREELAAMNYLVEEWGGKYQCQEISAKKGVNIDQLLDKVLLEAEMLELKANPNRNARGFVIESSLEKGRGHVAKLLVQNGTISIGDMVLAGYTYGRVKAMYNERNQKIEEAGPSQPVLMLGLNGAAQAGDSFNVMADEGEAKEIATRRFQLQREQGLRTQKHITLDEIGRRIAIGDFKELNLIIKGDVDGSVEALADALLKLSTKEVLVNVLHKSVGPITESDVLLASASNAIIIGFQVRPSVVARKLAESEQIDIRLYSIIYTAINELKSAIEGMLSPEIEEKITSNLEIREVFKIKQIGSVAGCFMLDGKITRSTKVRLIRNGIVVYSGKLGSLKRFKDDVKEVVSGQECGLNIENFNDIKVGDIVEGYEEFEVMRKL